jgi:tRNA G18 (ribose-2'-O)-methylase SpoU
VSCHLLILYVCYTDYLARYYGVTPPTKLVEFTTNKHAPVWLALDQVQDPRNLGAIIR